MQTPGQFIPQLQLTGRTPEKAVKACNWSMYA